MNTHLGLLFFLLLPLGSFGQHQNGELDDLRDFSTIKRVSVMMPDGILLDMNVTLPITSDSLVVELDLDPFGESEIEIIPRGTQLIYYDTLNGQPNPNPFRLPVILTRTPYNKEGDELGFILSILGYAHANQDMRGRYASEGVYIPMYSDAWDKSVYHSQQHSLDITEPDDPSNTLFHEDGYNTLDYLLYDMTRDFDFDNDSNADIVDEPVCNGVLGLFGASALGNSQYQLAAAHQIHPEGAGLKSMVPIVATNEHYRYTLYPNGVRRQSLVDGWILGQIRDLNEEMTAIDTSIQNNIHTPADYDLSTIEEVGDKALDYVSAFDHGYGIAHAYPNSLIRTDMDASRAPVNHLGEGDPTGTRSRYANMEIPAYHLTGWWDIYYDGQIETWNQMRRHLDPARGNRQMQKLVIGPWTHSTIGGREVGDQVFPESVMEVLGFNISAIDQDSLDVGAVLDSELLSWLRATLNQADSFNIGEPKIRIPASRMYQPIASGALFIKAPSEDYIITMKQMFRFLFGQEDLQGFPISIHLGADQDFEEISSSVETIPTGEPEGSSPINGVRNLNFKEIPDFRAYVAGPVGDGITYNAQAGNYWYQGDSFPFTNNITWIDMHLYPDGHLSTIPATSTADARSYIHDPDDPVITIGGGNLVVETPRKDRDASGPMNLAHPDFASFTLERPDVLHWATPPLADTLCIFGYPEIRLFASSRPEGAKSGDPTDTDFIVRVVDVYPDGREYYVFEGCVNARAREYAKAMVEGEEDIDAPFSNIATGEVYEYVFQMLPIAYTFGRWHRIKILISSSNYPRYQSNPNLPLEDGEYFRRRPNDGKTYTFRGVEMAPRPAINSIWMGMEFPSAIRLPVFGSFLSGTTTVAERGAGISLSPQPADQEARIHSTDERLGYYDIQLTDLLGRHLRSWKGIPLSKDLSFTIDTGELPAGLYYLQLMGEHQLSGQPLIVQHR